MLLRTHLEGHNIDGVSYTIGLTEYGLSTIVIDFSDVSPDDTNSSGDFFMQINGYTGSETEVVHQYDNRRPWTDAYRGRWDMACHYGADFEPTKSLIGPPNQDYHAPCDECGEFSYPFQSNDRDLGGHMDVYSEVREDAPQMAY